MPSFISPREGWVRVYVNNEYWGLYGAVEDVSVDFLTSRFGEPAVNVARGERAVIAVPELPREGSRRSAEARIEEAEGLAEAIGINVVAARAFRVRTIRH